MFRYSNFFIAKKISFMHDCSLFTVSHLISDPREEPNLKSINLNGKHRTILHTFLVGPTISDAESLGHHLVGHRFFKLFSLDSVLNILLSNLPLKILDFLLCNE